MKLTHLKGGQNVKLLGAQALITLLHRNLSLEQTKGEERERKHAQV